MRATWTRLAVGIGFTVAVALSVSATAQPPDPFVGTWKMDVAKSTYKPGPAPKSLIVDITAAADVGAGNDVLDEVLAEAAASFRLWAGLVVADFGDMA